MVGRENQPIALLDSVVVNVEVTADRNLRSVVEASHVALAAQAEKGRLLLVEEMRRSLVRSLAIAAAALLITVGFTGAVLVVVRRRVRPIRETAEVLEAVAQGDYQRQVVVHSDDEIGTMANSLNLVGQIKEAQTSIAAALEQQSATTTEMNTQVVRAAEASQRITATGARPRRWLML